MLGKNKPSVLVLGAGINALGIIRSFAKTNIPVIAVSWYKDFAMSSRFCSYKICPHPLNKKELLDFLIEYSVNIGHKPVLFATSDLFLLPVIEFKQELSNYYHIPFSDRKNLWKLLKKEHLYSLAEENNIPCPKTIVAGNNIELEKACNDIGLPLIIKPSVNINFSKILGAKAFVIKTKSELTNLLKLFSNPEIFNEQIIIQEFIPGEVTDLYTITCYSNRDREIMGYSIGHKIRQFPPETGTIISGKVVHVEEILESAKKFIQVSGFYGISNIEFKRDKRDNSYKLMEINPRSGVWNLSVLESGINLPLMAYKDILGEKIMPEFNKDSNLIWLISPLDLYYSIWGYKRKSYPDFKISFREWMKSIKGKKVEACFKWYDPLPFFKGLFMKYR